MQKKEIVVIVLSFIAVIISIRTCAENREANRLSKKAITESKDIATKADQKAVIANKLASEANSISKTNIELVNASNSISEKARKHAEDANKIAIRSLEISTNLSKTANRISEEALESSKTFSRIQAEVSWKILSDAYYDIDRIIADWEKQNNYASVKVESYSYEKLKNAISADQNIPADIKKLYLRRLISFENLRYTANLYKPFEERLTKLDLKLPDVPGVPIFATMGGKQITFGGMPVTFGHKPIEP